jgi:hypothetical protein
MKTKQVMLLRQRLRKNLLIGCIGVSRPAAIDRERLTMRAEALSPTKVAPFAGRAERASAAFDHRI